MRDLLRGILGFRGEPSPPAAAVPPFPLPELPAQAGVPRRRRRLHQLPILQDGDTGAGDGSGWSWGDAGLGDPA